MSIDELIKVGLLTPEHVKRLEEVVSDAYDVGMSDSDSFTPYGCIESTYDMKELLVKVMEHVIERKDLIR